MTSDPSQQAGDHKSKLSSMTGFARGEGAHKGHRWVWELRSVNGRGLEVRSRVPHGFDDLDMSLRPLAAKQLSRGNIQASLTLTRETETSTLVLNEAALDDVMQAIETLGARHPGLAAPTPEGILSIRGVLEQQDITLDDATRADLINALKASFGETVQSLQAMRASEGLAMAQIIAGQIDRIETLTHQCRDIASNSLQTLRERLAGQINDALEASAIDDDRLAQEVALLVVKADIREELDRLDAHIVAARELLTAGEPVGRKLDFLVQEFNREANTLCSKASDITMKQAGLEMKTVIDQLREQIQNVE